MELPLERWPSECLLLILARIHSWRRKKKKKRRSTGAPAGYDPQVCGGVVYSSHAVLLQLIVGFVSSLKSNGFSGSLALSLLSITDDRAAYRMLSTKDEIFQDRRRCEFRIEQYTTIDKLATKTTTR